MHTLHLYCIQSFRHFPSYERILKKRILKVSHIHTFEKLQVASLQCRGNKQASERAQANYNYKIMLFVVVVIGIMYTYKNISRNRSKEKSAKWNPINIAHKTQFKLLQHCIVCIYVFIIFIEHNTLTHTGGIDKEWEKAISRLYFSVEMLTIKKSF